jgi:hypothetical protein
MHKGVILLTKASTKSEAKENVDHFLEAYGEGDVWDYYIIGGRWSGTLNLKSKEFWEIIKKECPAKHPELGYTNKEIEKYSKNFQKIWDRIEGKGTNPLNRDSFGLDGVEDDDIAPASEVKSILKDWEVDRELVATKLYEKLQESWENSDNPVQSFEVGYQVRKLSNLVGDEFCFDSNTYDTTTYSNDIPEDLEGYYAVIVDMHN